MNLPQNKKLTYVLYVFEDGDAYKLDRDNASNFQENLKMAGGIISVRSYLKILPVDRQHIVVDGEDSEK